MTQRTTFPILPRSSIDPTGENAFARKAMQSYAVRIRKVREAFESALRSIKRKSISSLNVNARTYLYELTSYEIDALMHDLNHYVDRTMGDAWLYDDYVRESYYTGTVSEYTNLARQSQAYATQSLQQVLLADQFRRRESYVKNRVFEEMKKLNGQVRADMSRVLTDAIANGFGIQETVDKLKHFEGINEFRARRIARTEILTAYRRARVDEAQQARIDYGLKTKMLWSSAFAPTSRKWHMERHGKTYTEQEVLDFYSRDANAINCMCSQTAVLVDDAGKPINDILVERMDTMRIKAKEYMKIIDEVQA